jgi:hypothetical protein
VQDGNEDGRPHEFDRRSMLRKLAVGGSLVWASPMIAKRASALMPPSQCVNGAELNWTEIFPNSNPDLANGNTPSATFLNVDGSGVDITISSTFAGTTPLVGNYSVVSSPHGGITGKSLLLEQQPIANTPAGGTAGAGGQTVTITFSTTVRNISFVLTDIDNLDGNWSDRITTVGGTLTAPTSVTRPATVWGNGDLNNNGNGSGGSSGSGNGGNTGTNGAFRNSTDSDNLPNTSGAGNLRLNYSGGAAGISVVRFRYWCGGVGGGSNQLIRLGNISFDTCPEGVTPNFAPSAPVQAEARVGAEPDQPVAPLPGQDH